MCELRRYHEIDQDTGSLEHRDVLPPPIAADLNGDGRVEVITATHNARLHVGLKPCAPWQQIVCRLHPFHATVPYKGTGCCMQMQSLKFRGEESSVRHLATMIHSVPDMLPACR